MSNSSLQSLFLPHFQYNPTSLPVIIVLPSIISNFSLISQYLSTIAKEGGRAIIFFLINNILLTCWCIKENENSDIANSTKLKSSNNKPQWKRHGVPLRAISWARPPDNASTQDLKMSWIHYFKSIFEVHLLSTRVKSETKIPLKTTQQAKQSNEVGFRFSLCQFLSVFIRLTKKFVWFFFL